MHQSCWLRVFALQVLLLSSPTAVWGQSSASDDPQALLDEASSAFQAGKFERAHAGYVNALRFVEDPETGGRLLFNMGASSFELREFKRAENEFLQASKQNPSLRDRALCHAGFAALEDGDPRRAQVHLDGAGDSPDAIAEKEQLQAALDSLEKATRRQRRRDLYEAGVQASEAGRLVEARKFLEGALVAAEDAPPSDQALIFIALSRVVDRQGDSETAESYLTRAYELDPQVNTVFERGYIRASRGKHRGADADFAQALSGQLGEEKSAQAEAARRRLRRLPAGGVSLAGSVGLGYDSSAQHSATTVVLGFSPVLEDTPSAFISSTLGVGYALTPSKSTALTPSYRGTWIGLLEHEVRALSFQTHELALNFATAPNTVHRFQMRGAAAYSLIGLDDVSPFTIEALAAAQWSTLPGRYWETTVDLEYRQWFGLDSRPWLNGPLLKFMLGEAFSKQRVRARLRGGFEYLGIGTMVIDFPKGQLFHCAPPADEQPRCANRLVNQEGTYTIPLGYVSPVARFTVDVAVTSRITLGAFTDFAYRRYLEESYAEPDVPDPDLPPEATAKLREDWLTQWGARGTWQLSRRNLLALYLDYAMLLSRSNMEREEPYASPPMQDPDPNFDYDNRNFNQHVVEVGVSSEF